MQECIDLDFIEESGDSFIEDEVPVSGAEQKLLERLLKLTCPGLDKVQIKKAASEIRTETL